MEQQIPGKWVQVYIVISEGQIEQQRVFDMGHGQFAMEAHRLRSRGNKILELTMVYFSTIGDLFVGLVI